MRIGVYIDGFNLYYGARGLCGRSTPGWRWLDLRALATTLVGRRTSWTDAQVTREARQHVPVGVVNPSPNHLAGALRSEPAPGAGRHWWARLTPADLKDHQLPDPAGRYQRPSGW